jgi:hypothetical protein
MERIVYIVGYHVLDDRREGLYTYADRVFGRELDADWYAHKKNKFNAKGFEYVCPSEGTKEWHQYFVEPIVMEEV